MKPADVSFEDISIGDSASFERVFTKEDVQEFADLIGDENSLHVDEEYASKTSFKKPLVHGVLAGALFSTLVGMHLPGKRCLYLRQSLTFKNPIYIGDTLLVTGTVTRKVVSTRMLSLSISITCKSVEVIEGSADVQVLP